LDGPSKSPGRSLDPASNGGARGMVVTPKRAARRASVDRIRLTAHCDLSFGISEFSIQISHL